MTFYIYRPIRRSTTTKRTMTTSDTHTTLNTRIQVDRGIPKDDELSLINFATAILVQRVHQQSCFFRMQPHTYTCTRTPTQTHVHGCRHMRRQGHRHRHGHRNRHRHTHTIISRFLRFEIVLFSIAVYSQRDTVLSNVVNTRTYLRESNS